MIEILSKSKVREIEDQEIRDYLEYSFSRLPSDYLYPDYGYFVVIESFDELDRDEISLSFCTLPSFNKGLLDLINMVEVKETLIEIIILVDSDINVSFIVKMDEVPQNYLDEMLLYQI